MAANSLPAIPSVQRDAISRLIYFIITVLGFSFWFFVAVPLATHRESYEWLAQVHSQPFANAFSLISKTYRPLAQGLSWYGFIVLDPGEFPTSVLRQTVLQSIVYALFVLGWWLIYRTAAHRRLFAVIGCLAGGVFFSGYVQLFHIYGLFYVPVILIVGASLSLYVAPEHDKRELWTAVAATVLTFWHPFATALFVGFYAGFYLETFRRRTVAQHVRAVGILIVGALAIATLVVVVPTRPDPLTLEDRLFGFLVSYQTNEINPVASAVAFLLSQVTVASMKVSSRQKMAAALLTAVAGAVCFWKGLPLLLLWLCAVMVKLLIARQWSLLSLAMTAVVLPFGGGIGTPIYALFAIVVAIYATALEWLPGEKALSVFTARYAVGVIGMAVILLLMIRVGIHVPVVTMAASPLLAERERTYQLENILAWLHKSDYCGYEIAFVDGAGNPVDSVASAITRRHRPPAGLKEVQIFWNTVLRCRQDEPSTKKGGTAIVTFGGREMASLTPITGVEGKFAGAARVWISNTSH